MNIFPKISIVILTIVFLLGGQALAASTPTLNSWEGKISSVRYRSTAKIIVTEVTQNYIQCQIVLGHITGIGIPETMWNAKATLKKNKWVTKTPDGHPVKIIFTKKGQIKIEVMIKGPAIRFKGNLKKND